MKKKLYLIDGTALAYRSYYAFINNPLINSKGFPTSALFGVINSFLKLIDVFDPDHIAISFDRKEPTFRHKMAESYKIHRPPMPPDLIAQIDAIKDFFDLIGLKEISMAGYEADDVLGTLAVRYQNDFEVVIVTGDKDYAQLVNDQISLFDPKNDKFYFTQDVIDKYELSPDQFIDYLALVGDSADNIPGAKGIGPKTAVNLLKTYHDVKNLYQHIDEISSKSVKEKLIESQEQVGLSYTLATIETQVPLDPLPENHIHFHKSDLGKALDFLNHYELNQLVSRFKKLTGSSAPQVTKTIEEIAEPVFENSFEPVLITSLEMLETILSQASKSKNFSIDTETDSVESLFTKLVGISFCFESAKAYYLGIGHTFAQNLPLTESLNLFKKYTTDCLFIGHNFKFDFEVLENHGWKIENQVYDTMLAEYVLDAGRNRYSLDECARNEFNYEMIPIDQLIGKGKNQITFDAVEIETACRYSAEDAWVAYRLYEATRNRIELEQLSELFYKIEIPLVRVLAQMEKNGVYINTSFLQKLSFQANEMLNSLVKEIYQIAGQEFNINSTQQLAYILFEKMGIKPVKKTKTGFSTDSEVLETLAEEHDIAKKLIDYRQNAKLLNTYIDSLPKLIQNKTGRIHTSFNMTITSTGRLSSSNPNLQNIPIRTELGREIRRAFCAQDKDHCIISADYSQIELRLMALMAEDENMLDAFKHNQDIHTRTAALIFGKQPAEIVSDERRKAKVINFGIIYGMGAFSLAKELDISVKEAKQFIENYYNSFPKIISFIEKQKRFALEKGYVETLFGRKLFLPNIHSTNQGIRAESERIAVNMPIQGTAADLIKIAMINIHDKIKNMPKVKMIIQVHDELVFEVRRDFVETMKELIVDLMEKALPEQYREKIRLTAEIGAGENWAEAH